MEAAEPVRTPTIAVCLATCRRPVLLARALQSLAEQTFEPWLTPRVRVLVADNDEQQEGLAVVERLRQGFAWPLLGMHEPERGISFARNRLVAAAGECDYIAFIDDDETAAPTWLMELCRHALGTGAGAVLGPVITRFEAAPPPWLPDLLADPDLPDGSILPEGMFRTSSVLLQADRLRMIPGPFDPAFALTGGSDYMLGLRLAEQGVMARWAANAVVYETFPESRANLRWYLQRRFRTGMTFARAQRAQRGAMRGAARGLYRGAGSLVVGGRDLLRAATGTPTHRMRATGLLLYGLGNLAGATGVRYEEYKTIHGG